MIKVKVLNFTKDRNEPTFRPFRFIADRLRDYSIEISVDNNLGDFDFLIPDYYLYAMPISVVIALVFLTYFGVRFGLESRKRTEALNKLELAISFPVTIFFPSNCKRLICKGVSLVPINKNPL